MNAPLAVFGSVLWWECMYVSRRIGGLFPNHLLCVGCVERIESPSDRAVTSVRIYIDFAETSNCKVYECSFHVVVEA